MIASLPAFRHFGHNVLLFSRRVQLNLVAGRSCATPPSAFCCPTPDAGGRPTMQCRPSPRDSLDYFSLFSLLFSSTLQNVRAGQCRKRRREADANSCSTAQPPITMSAFGNFEPALEIVSTPRDPCGCGGNRGKGVVMLPMCSLRRDAINWNLVSHC